MAKAVKENIMRLSSNFALPLAALLFVFLLIPQSALAGTANCPAEPATNTRIASGDIFVGSNCVLKTTGDVDSFVFTGNKGDTWQLAAALNGAQTDNVCLTLYDPSFTVIYGPGCTGLGYVGGLPSVVTDQALTVTGTYTIDITENSSGTQEYAVSLERLYPFPPNAQTVNLGQTYAGDISVLTDSNAFIFEGVTTGEYEVAATLPSSPSANVCVTVYSPSGALITPSVGTEGGCTGIGYVGGLPYVQIDFTPTENGTYMAFVSVAGNDATQSYSLEVSCVVGKCKNIPPPPCTLKDTAAYNATSSTLTMNFTVGNTSAATWNAWLTDQNTITQLFSMSQPITNPPVAITKTASLPEEGKVGVLSTLTTPTQGIICSSWMQIATGTP